jgi:hypothetical protein
VSCTGFHTPTVNYFVQPCSYGLLFLAAVVPRGLLRYADFWALCSCLGLGPICGSVCVFVSVGADVVDLLQEGQ